MGRRLGAMVGLALALAACSTGTPTGGAGAKVLAPGQLERASGPIPGLVAPGDGRLIGPGFDLSVQGAVLAYDIAGWRAPAGDELVGFDLASDGAGADAAQNLITASVSAGATTAALSLSGLSRSGTAFVLAAPLRSDVVVHVSSQGVDEAFDLSGLRRVPTDPAVYYRNPDGTLPSDVVSSSQTVTAQTASAGSYPITYSLGTETLDYLSPAGIPAPAPDQAWLVTDLSEAPSGPVAPGNFQPIPPSRITLSFPGSAAPVPAQVDPNSGPRDYNGLLAGTYYFPVPAGLSAATLAIAGGTVGYADDLITYDSTATIGPASFPLSFTVPAPVSTPSGPSALSAPTQNKVSSTAVPLHRVSIGWLVAIGVAVLALLAGGPFWLARSRRRRPPGSSGRPAASAADEPGPARSEQSPPEPAAPTTPPETVPPEDIRPQPPVARAEPTTAAPGPTAVAPEPAGPATSRPAVVDPARIAPVPLVQAVLLGEPDWSGLLDPPSRCMELFLYLVTHPGRPWREDILSSVLRPELDAKPISVNTIRDYASDLRGALPEGVLLAGAKEAGGYRLSGSVGSDWDRLRALAEAARARPDEEAEALLEAAMALVKGRPFASVKAGTYGWADAEDLRPAMEQGIAGAAAALAGIRRRKGDLRGAADALAETRLLVGISHELSEEMLRIAAEQSASELGRVHRQVSEVLGNALDPLYQELLAAQPWLRRSRDPNNGTGSGPEGPDPHS